jgi:hypothetical protein
MIGSRPSSIRFRAAMAAAALGAASIFLPHWDPADHWATPDKHGVVVIEQRDDDPFEPHFISRLIEAVDALEASSTAQ